MKNQRWTEKDYATIKPIIVNALNQKNLFWNMAGEKAPQDSFTVSKRVCTGNFYRCCDQPVFQLLGKRTPRRFVS